MDAAMKELKLKRSVGLVDEEEYYAEMERLRDKYFEKKARSAGGITRRKLSATKRKFTTNSKRTLEKNV
ncbi:MAG: hypothetical protein L6V93_17345 [Clostridiales bacterium]|nr:MAG: hypothetical protein L6V93_17345 [Clostridiales bacterium]